MKIDPAKCPHLKVLHAFGALNMSLCVACRRTFETYVALTLARGRSHLILDMAEAVDDPRFAIRWRPGFIEWAQQQQMRSRATA